MVGRNYIYLIVRLEMLRFYLCFFFIFDFCELAIMVKFSLFDELFMCWWF